MIIEWTPCFDNQPAAFSQPEPDKIVIRHRGKEIAVDFSDASIVEYEIAPPFDNYIHRAWREGGVLHLKIPSFGRLDEDKTIDHGIDEEITWR